MPEPYQEKLLNGLKVLVWNDPAADKVTVKLRIHSGAAFDPKDKMGVMALLADIIFPDAQTFNYFEEDLEGKLEVTTNYDYIQITATGKADEFVNMLDTIRAGIVNTAITQENFVKVRDARLEKVKIDAAGIGAMADRAAAKRLLGEFPYGRPDQGTPESLARIDRFDLVGAKDKFLDADNATLAIVGKIEPRFAVKAAKQMLGGWGKSEGLVPSTFAQPGEPDTKTQLIDQPGSETAEIRFAMRGLAYNDNDFWTSVIWAGVLESMIANAEPTDCGGYLKVTIHQHRLPGVIMVSHGVRVDKAAQCFNAIKGVIAKIDSGKGKPETFSISQDQALTPWKNLAGDKALISDLWLNADTFKLAKFDNPMRLAKAATPADGDKVAARIFWKAPVVSVIVGDAAKIKSQFDGSTQFALTAEQEDQIRKEVTDFMSSWKASAEKRDLDENLKHYAPKLETYYKDTNKDQSDVRAERKSFRALRYDKDRSFPRKYQAGFGNLGQRDL